MGTRKPKYETIRVNMNLPIKLVERVKDFSDNFGIPATQGYILLLNSGLKQETMGSQLEMMNNIIENAKKIDPKLDEVEQLF